VHHSSHSYLHFQNFLFLLISFYYSQPAARENCDKLVCRSTLLCLDGLQAEIAGTMCICKNIAQKTLIAKRQYIIYFYIFINIIRLTK
jgi:hypothetical protein